MGVTGAVIELATIDERHRSPGLLKEFGTKIILRLGVDPVRLPSEILKRAITVARISPQSGELRWEEIREIGWANLPEDLYDCEWVVGRLNENTITEQAAVGVMLLLVHELEGAVLKQVLQVGDGGDYLVNLEGHPEPLQVEVSGIKTGSTSDASSRLAKKRGQIRGRGFVSVTTFQYAERGEPHSYLYFGGTADQPGDKKRRPSGKR